MPYGGVISVYYQRIQTLLRVRGEEGKKPRKGVGDGVSVFPCSYSLSSEETSCYGVFYSVGVISYHSNWSERYTSCFDKNGDCTQIEERERR